MALNSWVHKFFWCNKRGNTFRCQFQIKHANFWLPRSFLWHATDDKNSLHTYIDALTDKNKTVTELWENKGVATDHVYEPIPECGVIRVDPIKLMAFLRGEYVLEIPTTGRLLGSDPKEKSTVWMPQTVEAALLADSGPLHEMYVARLKELAATNQPLLRPTGLLEAPIKPMKPVQTEVWNPRCNVTGSLGFSPYQEPEAAPAPKPVAETEISRVQHDTHLEINYTYDGYFVRRLFRDDKPFWAASSYDTKEWKVFFIDQPIFDVINQPEMSV